ncbi:hypothetical protein [Chondrinema litorale]|uniref:hypothetical protein n=1 Tax=Chondrinema litorale TaxID=2994555 RepID=UPI002543D6D0|nr:hypothetical protein [Chondrinema litorale]UZR93144.1 hypothetical protein OQ292_14890 [Chondrinema litorale]
MNTQISNWFNGNQNYKEGVALFEQFGHNPVMLRQFMNGRAINMKVYLQTELKKLLKTSNRYEAKRQTRKKALQKQAIQHQEKTERPSHKHLSEYQLVEKYRKDQFVKFAQLRNTLTDLKTDEERATIIDQIDSLATENRQLWLSLDYFDKHGKWKNDQNPIEEFNRSAEPGNQNTEELSEEANNDIIEASDDTSHELKKATEDSQPIENSSNQAEVLAAKAEWDNLRRRISRAEKALEKLKATLGEQSSKTIKKQKDLFEMYAEKDQLFKILGK